MTERHYWKAKLAKGAPYIGVMTYFGLPIIDGEEHDRHARWSAMVRNETSSRMILMGDNLPIEVDGVFLRSIESVTEEEYLFLVKHAAYATKHAPHMPDAAPTQAIDWNKSRLPTFKRK